MRGLACPTCGALQPEEQPSFTCPECGGDLARPPTEPFGSEGDPSDGRPGELGPSPAFRRRRALRALVPALALPALVAVLAARWCLDRLGDEPGRALAERVLGSERVEVPIPLHELPPARSAGLETLPPAGPGAAVGARADGLPAGMPGERVRGSEAGKHEALRGDLGTIRGRITWGRVRPPPGLSFLSSDPDCGLAVELPLVPVEALGGVPEALVVALPEGGGAPAALPRTDPLVATLRACHPSPRLLAGPPETPVELRTVGAATHHLEASSPLPGLPGRLAPGQVLRTRLPASGTAHVVDPSHPWERITLVAVPTALAATVNSEGFFRLPRIPPGKVTLRFFTEATGPFERVVELPPSGDVMVQVDVADELPGFGPAASR